jgi:hypothetical protein
MLALELLAPPRASAQLPTIRLPQVPTELGGGKDKNGKQEGGSETSGHSDDTGAIIGGVAAAGILAGILSHHESLGHKLARQGPDYPDSFPMSAFTIHGFVKGGWPLVMDYEVEGPTDLTAEVVVGKVQPVTFRLDGTMPGVQHTEFTLPPEFGDKPQPGVIIIRAVSTGAGQVKPVPLWVHAIGCGPWAKQLGRLTRLVTPADRALTARTRRVSRGLAHACLSARAVPLQDEPLQPFDQVSFGEDIHLKQRSKAKYKFLPHCTCPNLAVDIFRVETSDGLHGFTRARRDEFKGGVQAETWVSKDWDGKTKGKLIPGRYRLEVYLWWDPAVDGSWKSYLIPDKPEEVVQILDP